MKQLLLKTAVVCTFVFGFLAEGVHAQIYSYTSATTGTPNSVAANATGTNLSRVNGAAAPGSPCSTGFSVSNFSSTTTFTTSLAAVEFTVTPNSGYQLNVTGFSAGLRRSGSGPASARFAYSTDGGTNWTDQGSNQTPNNASCGTTTTGSWTFTTTVSSGNIKIRIYGFSASATTGTFQILNATLNGTVAATCTAPSLSPSITNVTCNGGTDGAIDLTTTGGSSPFTYAWTKTGGGFTASTEDISGLSAGTYNITVTATGGCTVTDSYIVTEPAALSPIVTTASSCDSYIWSVDGNTYTSSGTYNTTIGCQPYTLDLTITASTSNTTTETACDSYIWSVDGNTYTSSGTYTHTTGCHTEILNLTIVASTTNVTSVTACSSYTWSVDGNTYTSSGTYTSTSGCHTEELDLTITTGTPPAKPARISGQQFNLCNASGNITYSIAAVSGANSYTWTAPSGTSIVSGNGTNSIELSISNSFTDGQLAVTADNDCGSSDTRTLFMHVKPSKPVIGGPACVSANQTSLTYTITNAEAGVTYTWKVPGAARITSGQGTSSITVDWRSISGVIQCIPSNTCATGAKAAYTVTVGCTAVAAQLKDQKMQVYPNPAYGVTTILFTSAKETKYKLVLTDMTGRQLAAKELKASAGRNTTSIDLGKYDNGIYTISLINDEGTQTIKIVKGQ